MNERQWWTLTHSLILCVNWNPSSLINQLGSFCVGYMSLDLPIDRVWAEYIPVLFTLSTFPSLCHKTSTSLWLHYRFFMSSISVLNVETTTKEYRIPWIWRPAIVSLSFPLDGTSGIRLLCPVSPPQSWRGRKDAHLPPPFDFFRQVQWKRSMEEEMGKKMCMAQKG